MRIILIFLYFTSADIAHAKRPSEAVFDYDSGGGGAGDSFWEVVSPLIIWIIMGWATTKYLQKKGYSSGVSVWVGIFGPPVLLGILKSF